MNCIIINKNSGVLLGLPLLCDARNTYFCNMQQHYHSSFLAHIIKYYKKRVCKSVIQEYILLEIFDSEVTY